MSADATVRVAMRDIPAREGRKLLVGDREIAVFNLGDRFLAVDNRCPHKSGPLSDGIVAGGAVVCPLHAWKIDLETGTVERPAGEAACVRTHRTRIDGEMVMIEVDASPHMPSGTCDGHRTEASAPASVAGVSA